MADTRRKTLGRHIMRARVRAGYESQEAFAGVAKMSEGSVANAERGAERVGAKVFTKIEDALGWPSGVIERYLASGLEEHLPAVDGGATEPTAEASEAVAMAPSEPSVKEQLEDVERELAELAEERRRLEKREEQALRRASELLGQPGERPEGDRHVG